MYFKYANFRRQNFIFLFFTNMLVVKRYCWINFYRALAWCVYLGNSISLGKCKGRLYYYIFIQYAIKIFNHLFNASKVNRIQKNDSNKAYRNVSTKASHCKVQQRHLELYLDLQEQVEVTLRR